MPDPGRPAAPTFDAALAQLAELTVGEHSRQTLLQAVVDLTAAGILAERHRNTTERASCCATPRWPRTGDCHRRPAPVPGRPEDSTTQWSTGRSTTSTGTDSPTGPRPPSGARRLRRRADARLEPNDLGVSDSATPGRALLAGGVVDERIPYVRRLGVGRGIRPFPARDARTSLRLLEAGSLVNRIPRQVGRACSGPSRLRRSRGPPAPSCAAGLEQFGA